MNVALKLFRRLDSRGTAAIEFALILPIFLTMIFGIMEISRLIWWQVSLERAAAVGSRCGAVAALDCGTDDQIKAKAADSVSSLPFNSSNFAVSRIEPCGVRVTATATFKVVASLVGIPDQPLRATFCHPLTQAT
jgi:Flp pilus assembly protein TadG